MFRKIMQEIDKEFKGANALEYTRGVWNNDRWFTFPKILDGAKYCVDVMKNNGLSTVEIIQQPADGRLLDVDLLIDKEHDPLVVFVVVCLFANQRNQLIDVVID